MISIINRCDPEEFDLGYIHDLDLSASRWGQIVAYNRKSTGNLTANYHGDDIVGNIIYITKNNDVIMFKKGEIGYLVERFGIKFVFRSVDCKLWVENFDQIPF